MTTGRFFIVLMLVLGIASCGGGGAEVTSTVSGATLGQELQDLEEARRGRPPVQQRVQGFIVVGASFGRMAAVADKTRR